MENNLTWKQRQQWFIDRIGKTVHRANNDCNCESCKSVCAFGVLIRDRDHAIYLNDASCEMGIKYYDKKTEVK